MRSAASVSLSLRQLGVRLADAASACIPTEYFLDNQLMSTAAGAALTLAKYVCRLQLPPNSCCVEQLAKRAEKLTYTSISMSHFKAEMTAMTQQHRLVIVLDEFLSGETIEYKRLVSYMRNLLLAAGCVLVVMGTNSTLANLETMDRSREDSDVPWAYFLDEMPALAFSALHESLEARLGRPLEKLPKDVRDFLEEQLPNCRGLVTEMLYDAITFEWFDKELSGLAERYAGGELSEHHNIAVLDLIREAFQLYMKRCKPSVFGLAGRPARIAMCSSYHTETNIIAEIERARDGEPLSRDGTAGERALQEQCVMVNKHFALLRVNGTVLYSLPGPAPAAAHPARGCASRLAAMRPEHPGLRWRIFLPARPCSGFCSRGASRKDARSRTRLMTLPTLLSIPACSPAVVVFATWMGGLWRPSALALAPHSWPARRRSAGCHLTRSSRPCAASWIWGTARCGPRPSAHRWPPSACPSCRRRAARACSRPPASVVCSAPLPTPRTQPVPIASSISPSWTGRGRVLRSLGSSRARPRICNRPVRQRSSISRGTRTAPSALWSQRIAFATSSLLAKAAARSALAICRGKVLEHEAPASKRACLDPAAVNNLDLLTSESSLVSHTAVLEHACLMQADATGNAVQLKLVDTDRTPKHDQHSAIILLNVVRVHSRDD
eukprot:m.191708 g.191708  ORF g.191708 m.191708 type:complete len:667 (-) comp10050_c0_seq3:263-2263(-)